MKKHLFRGLFLLPVFLLISPIHSQRAVRMCAEWEPAIGSLIRWPLGIPSDLVVELAKDDSLYVTVSSQSVEDNARSSFSSWGVNLDHCVFIRTQTNTHYPRDWGPHCTFDEQGIGGILDAAFNGWPRVDGCLFEENPVDAGSRADYFYVRESPSGQYDDDDKVNLFFANQQGWPHRAFPTDLTGGNVMVDGYTSAISTHLMIYENESICNEVQFKNYAKEHLGITNYTIVNNPEPHGIQHIDCFAKFLDEETILVKEIAQGNQDYECVERLVEELQELKSCFGRPYKILRILCGPYENPKVAAYTNSLILNKKVLVPLFNVSTDSGALETFRKVMPGYEVKGFEHRNKWYSHDALHCRVMAIFDRFMLWLSHKPLDAEIDAPSTIAIKAVIDDRNDAGLIESDCQVFWRKKGATQWESTPFHSIAGIDSFAAEIPAQNSGTDIEYYLTATDLSGRIATLPRSAPDWLHRFKVVNGTQINPSNKTVVNELIQLKVTIQNIADIQFLLAGNSQVTLSITDLLGKNICTLLKNTKPVDIVTWDGKNSSGVRCHSGIYFMVLKMSNKSIAKPFIILK